MSRRPIKQGAKPRRRVLSIRWIVTASAVVLTTLSIVAVGTVNERHAQRNLLEQIQSSLVLQARNLALSSSDPLLADFPELTLHPLVKELLAGHDEFAFAVVLDHEAKAQGHADARSLGEPYALPDDLTPVVEASLAPGEGLLSNDRLLVARTPVRDLAGRSIGTAIVGIHRSYIEGMLVESRRQLLLVMGIVVALGVAASFLLMSQLLRPIGALREGLARIGRGELDTPISLKDRTELGLLADTVNDMASELKEAQAEMIERERLAHEVDLARRIQRSLLPSKPTTAHGTKVLGTQRAAAEVGGDYYDVLPLSDGRVALAIADVSGKGLAGCMVMTMVSSLLRAFREVYESPAALLASLDERLAESLEPGVFVTMFFGILDPVRGELVFASAGHNPMLVYRATTGTVDTIDSPGIPLAALRNGAILSTLKNQRVTLAPGDVLVEYTDGFTEAPSAINGEEFGIDRLRDALVENAPEGPDQVLHALSAAIHTWTGTSTPNDDETLLVAARSTAATAQAAPEPRATDDVRAALAALEHAEREGSHLVLPARLDSMGDVLHWIADTPVLKHLGGKDAKILGTALYEACANVAEHGYDENAARTMDVWWVAARDGGDPGTTTGYDAAVQAGDAVRRGLFVIRDDGKPFQPSDWTESDFSKPDVRMQLRGFGLDILHRAMRRVDYVPSTPRGNITLLTYGPRQVATELREGGSS